MDSDPETHVDQIKELLCNVQVDLKNKFCSIKDTVEKLNNNMKMDLSEVEISLSENEQPLLEYEDIQQEEFDEFIQVPPDPN